MDQKKPISRTNTVIGSLKWWSSNSNNNNTNSKGFGSSIAAQKLRESKWFGPDECRILCAVIESGFIVEIKEGQENDGTFGVVSFKAIKGETLYNSRYVALLIFPYLRR